MRMPVAIVLALAAVITTAFASDYVVKEVKLLPIDSYPARVTVGDITIAADPYATDEKSYTAFDYKNLNTRGYHPIHLIIRNATSDYITIRTRNIVLRDTDGSELYATSAAVLVSDLYKGNLSYQRGSPFSDFSGKELSNRRIDPKGTVNGFLFFFMPQKKGTALAGTQLVIPEVLNDSTRKPIGPFVIPLDPGIQQGGEEQKSK
jgi:hypothetical protein